MDELLTVCLIVALVYGIVTSIHIYKTNVKLKEFYRILLGIEAGKNRQKFLMKGKNNVNKIGFRLNEILYEYEEIIEEMNTALESDKQLLTGLSHDIRTPMTTLIGYLDAIELQLVDRNKRKEYLKSARRKAYNLKDYTDTLFDWSRIKSGEEIFYNEPVDIIETTRHILTDWIPVLDERRMSYEINIPESIINVDIDVNCYMRIINNIIQNILVHSKAKKITVTAKESKKRFLIKICDNGIGIEKEKLKFIFERFYKCDTGRSGKGTGLGLNIAKILTEKMNGEIQAYSEINKGTAFSIEFPIYYR